MYTKAITLLLTALLLLACEPEWKVVRGATESGSPKDVPLGTTVERVYNCGLGGDTLYLTPFRSISSGKSLYWEKGTEFEQEADGSLSGGFGLGLEATAQIGTSLGLELQEKYGENYELGEEVGTGWQLPAQPGEWLEYTLQWSEVWVWGDIQRENGKKLQQIDYRLRRAIRSEIVDKKLLRCDDTAAPAAGPTPTPANAAPTAPFQLTIRGYGFPPESMTNPAQRRQAALLAAQMDAKRNLAVWLAGEDIEAVTIVENNQVASDEIRREVSAWLVGVRILSEEYDEASGQATVEIAPALGGN